MSLLRLNRSGFVFVRTYSVASLGFVLFAGIADAGISLVSQTRFVDVNANGIIGVVSPPSEKRMDAPDFGPFNQSVNLSIMPPVAFANETVSQNSIINLAPDGKVLTIVAQGSQSTGPASPLHGTNHCEVSFDLTQPEPYTLSYNGQEGDPRDPHLDSFVPGSFLGPSAPGTLAPSDPHTSNFFTVVSYSGMLQPGTYTLLADVNTIGSGSFAVNLAVGSAVPVPSAAWAGAIMLSALVLINWLRNLKPSKA